MNNSMATYLKSLLKTKDKKLNVILFTSFRGLFVILFFELFFYNLITLYPFILGIFINASLNVFNLIYSKISLNKHKEKKEKSNIVIIAVIQYILYNLIAQVRYSSLSFIIPLNYALICSSDFLFSNSKKKIQFRIREINIQHIFLLIQIFIIPLFNSFTTLAGILIILLLINKIYITITQIKNSKLYEILDIIKLPTLVVDKEMKEIYSNSKFKKLVDSFDEENSLENIFNHYLEISTNISLNMHISQFQALNKEKSNKSCRCSKEFNNDYLFQKINVYKDAREARKMNPTTIVLHGLENMNLLVVFINAKRIGIKKYLRQKISQNYEVLANFSTEVKTPFNGVWGVFSLLKEVVSKDLEKHFRIAENSSIFLLNSINCLTDFSLINSKNIKLNPRPCNIQDLKKKLEDLFHDMSDENNIILSFNFSELPEVLYFDYDRIEQILICSIESLLDSAQRRSSITIDANLTKENFIHFAIKLNSNIEPNLNKSGVANNIKDLQSTQSLNLRDTKQNFENINLKMTKKLIEGMGCKLSIIKYGSCGIDLSFSIKNEVVESPFFSQNKDLNLFIIDNSINQFKIQLKPTNYGIRRRTSIDNLGVNTLNKLQNIVRKESLKKTPENGSSSKCNNNSDNVSLDNSPKKNDSDENISEENSAEGILENVSQSVLSHVFRKSSDFCSKGNAEHNRVYTMSFHQPKSSFNSPKDENQIKILVVDDNTYNRWLLIQMVSKRFKYTIMEAKNGLEACQIAHKESLNLIFMDLRMPIMDGIEATKKIKEDQKKKKIFYPIIAVSAEKSESERAKCRAVGMDYFIEKPVKLPELYDIISKWLP